VTFEGWQSWDVALKSASQLRVVPGVAIGLDLGVGMRLGKALGYEVAALAELLPAAETGLIEGLNRRLANRTPDTPQNP